MLAHGRLLFATFVFLCVLHEVDGFRQVVMTGPFGKFELLLPLIRCSTSRSLVQYRSYQLQPTSGHTLDCAQSA